MKLKIKKICEIDIFIEKYYEKNTFFVNYKT
jgi:hypothetical protein